MGNRDLNIEGKSNLKLIADFGIADFYDFDGDDAAAKLNKIPYCYFGRQFTFIAYLKTIS